MRKRYITILILSILFFGCKYSTYEDSYVDEYSLEYIKKAEKLDKIFTYAYRPSNEYMKFGITYDVIEFYENHFARYSYGIFDFSNLNKVELIKYKTGDFKKVASGYTLKYVREYDVDFNKHYNVNTKEDLNLYQKYVWPEHYIESLIDNKKITVTFTTPNEVLTDFTEYGYFEIYNMKLKVEDCNI